jgi:hypothetical protein
VYGAIFPSLPVRYAVIANANPDLKKPTVPSRSQIIIGLDCTARLLPKSCADFEESSEE